ncbi:MAG: hypothetical protein U5R14_09860 [Gemmatimonadota bacterium]|nr:hypothetical protein [Gemmatimonadota bacterium]
MRRRDRDRRASWSTAATWTAESRNGDGADHAAREDTNGGHGDLLLEDAVSTSEGGDTVSLRPTRSRVDRLRRAGYPG